MRRLTSAWVSCRPLYSASCRTLITVCKMCPGQTLRLGILRNATCLLKLNDLCLQLVFGQKITLRVATTQAPHVVFVSLFDHGSRSPC